MTCSSHRSKVCHNLEKHHRSRGSRKSGLHYNAASPPQDSSLFVVRCFVTYAGTRLRSYLRLIPLSNDDAYTHSQKAPPEDFQARARVLSLLAGL